MFSLHVCADGSWAAVKVESKEVRGVFVAPPSAHKNNWPENTWSSHQGPTLAIISPRGTICKMNTLIKKCAHVYEFWMCLHIYTSKSQFSCTTNKWQHTWLSLNQRVMCCLWCLTAAVRLCLCFHSFYCVQAHLCVYVCAHFPSQCVCICLDLCVCHCLTTPHT